MGPRDVNVLPLRAGPAETPLLGAIVLRAYLPADTNLARLPIPTVRPAGVYDASAGGGGPAASAAPRPSLHWLPLPAAMAHTAAIRAR